MRCGSVSERSPMCVSLISREVESQTSGGEGGLGVVGPSGSGTEEWAVWSTSAVILVVVVVFVAHVSGHGCVYVLCVYVCV